MICWSRSRKILSRSLVAQPRVESVMKETYYGILIFAYCVVESIELRTSDLMKTGKASRLLLINFLLA